MPKIFSFRGHSLEELKKMSIEEFYRLLKSRERRSLKRGFTDNQKKLLEKIRKDPEKFHKTHIKDMVILPEMVGVKIGLYLSEVKEEGGGRKWFPITITPEMIGHRIGEFAMTTKRVRHSSPGLGATKGSKFFATKK